MINPDKHRFILTLLTASDLLASRGRSEGWSWLVRASTIADNSDAWRDLSHDAMKAFAGRLTRPNDLEGEVAALVAKGVGIVLSTEPQYSRFLRSTLQERAPLFLYYRGNPTLFAEPSIGFCGSRHASERGIAVCKDVVEQLAERQITVTAGYAAGVDQVAHKTALQGGGKTIAVLPEGILNFSVRQVLAEAWDWRRALVVSEFLPNARWAVGKAMQRNRTIIGLSQALVVVEARSSGGTFEAGREAISLNHPLFATMYSDDLSAQGNTILLENGAIPIKKNRETGRARIDGVIEAFSSDPPRNSESQSSLLP